jgi:hypothetical protein
VAHLGISLQHARVQAIVLTASMAEPSPAPGTGLSLPKLALQQITVPVLIVHHKEDGCEYTRYADAQQLAGQFTSSAGVSFVTVEGGDPARDPPCEALAPHGFLGKEREVVSTIADWATGKPIASQIGP